MHLRRVGCLLCAQGTGNVAGAPIVSNCCTAGDPVRKLGDEVSATFEALWNEMGVESSWRQHQQHLQQQLCQRVNEQQREQQHNDRQQVCMQDEQIMSATQQQPQRSGQQEPKQCNNCGARQPGSLASHTWQRHPASKQRVCHGCSKHAQAQHGRLPPLGAPAVFEDPAGGWTVVATLSHPDGGGRALVS